MRCRSLFCLLALLIAPTCVVGGTDADDPIGVILAEARKRFGDPLSDAEQNLFRCFVKGEEFKPNAPPFRTKIQADRIAWACATPRVAALVTHKGILINNVEIDGGLELANVKILFPLSIQSSTISSKIDLTDAEVRSLCLDGSTIGEFAGRSMKSAFGVQMGNGFHASKPVDLSNAEIGGDLNLNGGQFHYWRSNDKAIYADYMHVGRELLMGEGFEAQGVVSLTSAVIDGAVNCDGGHFNNKGNKAIDAAGMLVKSNLHFSVRAGDRPFQALGLVELSNARIGGNLYCAGGRFEGSDTYTGHAIRARGMDVGGDVDFKRGFLTGRVELTVARVGGSLYCQGGEFQKPVEMANGHPERGETALDIESATVGHDVHLGEGFQAIGIVNLSRSSIGGNLDGAAGLFHHPQRRALIANGMSVKGSVFFNKNDRGPWKGKPFRVVGSVSLVDARVGGDLDCGGGQFSWDESKGRPLKADQAVLDASGAEIDGDALLNKSFEPFGKLTFVNAKIGRTLLIEDVFKPAVKHLSIDLTAARAGALKHHQHSWPMKDALIIDGFAYDSVDPGNPMDADLWSQWLKLQRVYAGGPHEQLATVFLKSGRGDDAKLILIDKESWKGQHYLSTNHPYSLLWVGRSLWYSGIGPIIRFGYGPEYSFGCGLGFILGGCLIFSWGKKHQLFARKDPGSPPRPFVPWLYSIDLFTPVISFYEREAWVLDLTPGRGQELWKLRLFRGYWMFHVFMGWVITSLVVAGLLGMIHHD